MSTKNFSNGFENSKSLTEQINEVKNSKASRAEKIEALIKIGLMRGEAMMLLKSSPSPSAKTAKRFSYTFGVEIECIVNRIRMMSEAHTLGVNVRYESYNHTDNKEYFKFVTDASVQDNNGRNCYNGSDAIECVSPILNGNKKGFDTLKDACTALNNAGAYVNRTTGLHVHISTKDLSDKQYINVFRNYQALESIIDSFMARSRRASDSRWCASLLRYNFCMCQTKRDVYNVLHGDRYHKVNPVSWGAHQTIEFRQHQGTTSFEKISMWVAFCAKLVEYSKENVITDHIYSINDVPFLNNSEKAFFASRIEELAA